MPDMSKAGAHIQGTFEDLKHKGQRCRQEAATLITRAEIYEDAAMRLRDAIDKEAAKKPAEESA